MNLNGKHGAGGTFHIHISCTINHDDDDDRNDGILFLDPCMQQNYNI